MKVWLLILRLADNASSVLEGFFIWLMFILGGLAVGAGWALKEIVDDWSVPLTHAYKDSVK